MISPWLRSPTSPARSRPCATGSPRSGSGSTCPAPTRPAGPGTSWSARSTTTCCPGCGRLDAPLLAVVGGSTGAGKSTLVNTLVGAEVTPAGVLRPTTRGAGAGVRARTTSAGSPTGRVLPGLARIDRRRRAARRAVAARCVVRTRPSRPGWRCSTRPTSTRSSPATAQLAAQLLAAADLWIFVTTAARYADAVPWDLLHTAQQRGTALAVVLNRVPPEAMREISDAPRPDARRERAEPGRPVRACPRCR